MPPHGGYVHVYMRGCEATAPRYQYLSRAPETLSAHLSMRKEIALDIIIRIRRASSADEKTCQKQKLKVVNERCTVLF